MNVIAICCLYYLYNNYMMERHIILKAIIGRSSLYPPEYDLRKGFFKLRYSGCYTCWVQLCCKRHKIDDDDYWLKVENLKACQVIIREKMNLQNYLHDSIDFQAIKQLILKSRHKILMPILVLN